MNGSQQHVAEPAPGKAAVYLIQPRLGGLANDTVIQMEKGGILYHVKARLFAPLGRQYAVYDRSMKEILRTDQDNTAFFPHHTIFQNDHPIGKLGQAGIMPQRYFVQLPDLPRAEIHLGSASPICALKTTDGVVIADVAQHRSMWIVIIPTATEHFLILSSLGIIYRESTIAGC
jgi:hypothetical protein